MNCSFKNCSFGSQILLTITSILVGFALLMIVAAFFPILPMKWLQFVQTILIFVLPTILVAALVGDQPFRYLSFEKKGNFSTFALVFVLALVQIPLINGLVALNEAVVLPDFLSSVEQWLKTTEEAAKILTEKLLTVTTWQGLLVNILVMAVAPALGEELLFRGLLQRIFSGKMGKHAAVWLTAFLFSAVHFQFYGFVPRMLLGAIFGYLLLWTKNLWVPIFAHFLNNATVVIFFFLEKNNYIHFSIDNFGTGNLWWQAVASGAIALWLLKKIAKLHFVGHLNTK